MKQNYSTSRKKHKSLLTVNNFWLLFIVNNMSTKKTTVFFTSPPSRRWGRWWWCRWRWRSGWGRPCPTSPCRWECHWRVTRMTSPGRPAACGGPGCPGRPATWRPARYPAHARKAGPGDRLSRGQTVKHHIQCHQYDADPTAQDHIGCHQCDADPDAEYHIECHQYNADMSAKATYSVTSMMQTRLQNTTYRLVNVSSLPSTLTYTWARRSSFTRQKCQSQ